MTLASCSTPDPNCPAAGDFAQCRSCRWEGSRRRASAARPAPSVLLCAGLARASRRGAERRVLEHAWLVLDQLDAAVEGPVLDHLESDVGVAVVDAFLARGPGDHREHPDPEAVDEAGP